MTYDRLQEYRENVAAIVRRPDDHAVFALTSSEPTWGELRIVAHTMLIRKRSAEVYVEIAGQPGYYLPVVMRVDEQGDLILVVAPTGEAR